MMGRGGLASTRPAPQPQAFSGTPCLVGDFRVSIEIAQMGGSLIPLFPSPGGRLQGVHRRGQALGRGGEDNH